MEWFGAVFRSSIDTRLFHRGHQTSLRQNKSRIYLLIVLETSQVQQKSKVCPFTTTSRSGPGPIQQMELEGDHTLTSSAGFLYYNPYNYYYFTKCIETGNCFKQDAIYAFFLN